MRRDVEGVLSALRALFAPLWDKTAREETAFLPAALEIVETPPAPASRMVAFTLILFFAVALLWAGFGSVDIIAAAQGKIVPTGRTKIIQPFETGVVRAIHVQDGQAVKTGDVLVEINSTINAAERDRLQKELLLARLDRARLKAVLAMADNPSAAFVAVEPPEGATEQQMVFQSTLKDNQIAEFRAKLAGIDRQLAQNEGNRTAVASTIQKIDQSLPWLNSRAKVRKGMATRSYDDKKEGEEIKVEHYTAQQDLIEHEKEREVQQGRLKEAESSLAALKEQRRQTQAEFHRTTLNSLSEAEQKVASLQEQFKQAEQKYTLQTLKAPVDGTVQQLAVHTEGGVVTPAQVLMAIVPADSHLEIEAMISNRDIGFVHTGQDAAVKVDTFTFTKYGLLHGHVLTVSQDSILRNTPESKSEDKKQIGAENDSSEPKGQELVYLARIALDETDMQIDERRVPLTPGMAVTAEIKTGTRRIIDYLLSPLARHAQQALRER
jgi:hemolysin D